jgi:hypothetical protein
MEHPRAGGQIDMSHEKYRRLILTSRADSVEARLASCAVAVLVVQARRDSAAKAMV